MNIPAIYESFFKKLPTGIKFYIVGGTVRDQFLGLESNDIDIATSEKEQKEIARIAELEGYSINTDGLKFGVIVVYLSKTDKLDVAMYRGEKYDTHSRKPDVEAAGSIEEDLSRRDFTINALAYDYRNEVIIDPYGGREDLRNHLIRAVGNPDERFREDPLRMLRAARFASKFNFDIDDETFHSIEMNIKRLDIISRERIREELLKGFGKNKDSYFWTLYGLGLLQYIFPEFEGAEETLHDTRGSHYKENLIDHTSDTLKNNNGTDYGDNALFNIALLLHDIAKTKTGEIHEDGKISFLDHDSLGADIARKRLTELKFSNNEVKFVSSLIKYHMYIHETERLPYAKQREHLARVFLELHEDSYVMESLIKLSECDGKRDNGIFYEILITFYRPYLIKGEDVLKYPERFRGKILKRMRFLQLAKQADREALLKRLHSEAQNLIIATENKERKEKKQKVKE